MKLYADLSIVFRQHVSRATWTPKGLVTSMLQDTALLRRFRAHPVLRAGSSLVDILVNQTCHFGSGWDTPW